MPGDHTKINIAADPTAERLSGVAVHGDTPFDVPYISEIVPGLWQGGCETGLILPNFISHVVSLYPWERYRARHETQSELYVRMYDAAGGEVVHEVKRIAEWVNHCRESGGGVLVHCQAGLNRSSLVVAVSLILKHGWDPQVVIDTIRDERSDACLCNPHFAHLVRTVDWKNV